ncbi:lipocalin 3 [Mus musculus]|nr:Lipocalin 3 [Mus musculus]AAI16819.1 Lipocalin 3 [Mus musculus]EDL08277.1 lipocalin 3 [Mus musculus]BAA07581.1 VNSP I [Mus musculus]|eukprot:NP_034824.1 vomeronasal secretory protein 1 precursor [Mus musculus]
MQTLEMRALLLIISFCLVAVLQAQDSSFLAFNNGNFSGKWFLKALVSEDDIPINKVSPMLILVLNNGDIELSITHMIYDQCLEVTTILEKTDVPGQYLAFEGKTHLQVQLSSVKGHYMLYCDGEIEGMRFLMTQLIGRDPQENLEALEEFKVFTQIKGLVAENLVILEQMEKCEPESFYELPSRPSE